MGAVKEKHGPKIEWECEEYRKNKFIEKMKQKLRINLDCQWDKSNISIFGKINRGCDS